MAQTISKRQQRHIEGTKTSSEVEELALVTAKRGVIYVIGDVLTSILTLVLLIFLAFYLQPANFGIYSIVIAFATLLGIGSNFGVGTAFRKMLPELNSTSRISRLLSSGYALSLGVGAAVAIVGILISGWLASSVYHNPSLTLLFMIGSIAEFINVLYQLSLAAQVGVGLVKEATISNAVYSSASLVLSVILVLLGYGVVGAVIGFTLGLLAGGLVGIAYLMIKAKCNAVRPSKEDSKKLTSFSMPVVASHVAMNGAANFAVLFLGIFVTATIVGNYGAAYKLARFVEIIITDIALILLPAFSRALMKVDTAKKIGALYNNSVYYTALILFPMLAYLISVSTPLIRLLFPASYVNAPLYFAVMVAGMAVGLIGTYAGTLIVGFGNTKRFMIYQVSAVAIQLILLVVLTPYLKDIGVLLSLFVITPLVLDLIYIRALRHQFKLEHKYAKLIKVSLVSIIILAILYPISYLLNQSKIALVTNLVIMLVLYPALLALFKGANKKNLEFIEKIGGKLLILKPLFDGLVRYSSLFIKR